MDDSRPNDMDNDAGEMPGLGLDLPPVAERAAARLDGCGLGGRINCRGGDFHGGLPTGAEAITLASSSLNLFCNPFTWRWSAPASRHTFCQAT